ncbi:MAG: M15 family metallopeptidase [Treponema sp.]|nr:M15 family metallopeptidase [Treponema sp.]
MVWLVGADPAASAQTPSSQRTPDRGEQVMKALSAAYSGRVGPAVFRKTAAADAGDWAVQIDGVWFYYAQGSLLPEQLRNRHAEYDPQPFYNYPGELPPWKDPGPEETQRFRDSAQRRAANPPKRSQHFFDALWRAGTREESYDRVKTIRFLGRSVMVHYSILEELALVEERILGAAKTSAEVRQWINRLDTLAGWNWRTIADTQSRSFHAYGAALDLLPRSHGGLQTYWLWTAENFPSWWAVPYERRSHPPEAVIKAFEEYGFIWGGKWLFFDTMHFEYRPEILLLSNMTFKIAT